MRLIDADAIYKILELCEIKKDTYGNLLNDWDYGYNCGIERAESEIECAPKVDAVPVIRCKDCKWYGRADKRRFYRGMDCLQNRIATIVPDEDYCSRAERKEE